MGSIAQILKIQEQDNIPVINAELLQDDPAQEEIFEQQELAKLPSQQQYEEEWNKKHMIPDNLQNQTHSEICANCTRTMNNTPNPKPRMLYCKYNGVMVFRHQTSCGYFKSRININKSV